MKLWLCNYYGMCDKYGKLVGHSGKVTREYASILCELMDETCLIASPCIVGNVDSQLFSKIESLPYDISIENGSTIIKRILDKIKIWINVWKCMRKKDGVLFFYQVDFFFFLFLFIHGKFLHRNIYLIMYHTNFTGGKAEGLLQLIYRRAIRYVKGVFYTSITADIPHDNKRWIPDFYYSASLYDKYYNMHNMNKEERCVCLGTMNRFKELETLIDLFRQRPYSLEIVGKFDDADRFQRLRESVINCPNIIIDDRILNEDEYYQKMATAKYNFLPYSMEQYINRTSGVLQEVIFVGSTPVAPSRLLKQTKLPGIEYDNLESLDLDKLISNNITVSKEERDNTVALYSKRYMYRMFCELLIE